MSFRCLRVEASPELLCASLTQQKYLPDQSMVKRFLSGWVEPLQVLAALLLHCLGVRGLLISLTDTFCQTYHPLQSFVILNQSQHMWSCRAVTEPGCDSHAEDDLLQGKKKKVLRMPGETLNLLSCLQPIPGFGYLSLYEIRPGEVISDTDSEITSLMP